MKSARIDDIEQYILKERTVSLERLCEKFKVSKSTARRDLEEVVKRGKVKKVYGGVQALESPASSMPLLSFQERSIINRSEKLYICQKAAQLVAPGDVIFLDTGSTCIKLVEELKNTPCTIITNSLEVSLAAIPYENLTVITAPGRLNRKTLSFTGPDVALYLRSLNIQKAFMATTGVSLRGGLTNASEDEYQTKKSVCQNSQQIYLLADHDKFGRIALYTYSELNKLTGLITDQRPSEEMVSYCRDCKIRLIY